MSGVAVSAECESNTATWMVECICECGNAWQLEVEAESAHDAEESALGEPCPKCTGCSENP